jgi:hypothetical protein
MTTKATKSAPAVRAGDVQRLAMESIPDIRPTQTTAPGTARGRRAGRALALLLACAAVCAGARGYWAWLSASEGLSRLQQSAAEGSRFGSGTIQYTKQVAQIVALEWTYYSGRRATALRGRLFASYGYLAVTLVAVCGAAGVWALGRRGPAGAGPVGRSQVFLATVVVLAGGGTAVADARASAELRKRLDPGSLRNYMDENAHALYARRTATLRDSVARALERLRTCDRLDPGKMRAAGELRILVGFKQYAEFSPADRAAHLGALNDLVWQKKDDEVLCKELLGVLEVLDPKRAVDVRLEWERSRAAAADRADVAP